MITLSRIIIFVITLILLNSSIATSKENYAYINLEKIIKNSNYGRIILTDIQNLNDSNIAKLKEMENELRSNENELNLKKKILSEKEFEIELNILKEKILSYREKKDQLTLNFETQQKKNLDNFFLEIQPIVQEFMNENSIDILFRKDNIFMGKNSADVTEKVIQKINKKLN